MVQTVFAIVHDIFVQLQSVFNKLQSIFVLLQYVFMNIRCDFTVLQSVFVRKRRIFEGLLKLKAFSATIIISAFYAFELATFLFCNSRFITAVIPAKVGNSFLILNPHYCRLSTADFNSKFLIIHSTL